MKPSDLYDGYYANGDDNDLGSEERVLFELVARGERGALLDVGCGAGNIGAELAKMGFQVAGVDHSPEAVRLAKERGLDAMLADLDSEGLKCDGKTFDVVWAGDVIEHVFDP